MAFDIDAYLETALEPKLNAHPRLKADLAEMEANLQIELLEAPAGEEAWCVALSKGVARVRRGACGSLSATLRAHVLDWKDLLEGFASPQAALTDGRLEIEGDLAVAARVTQLLFPED